MVGVPQIGTHSRARVRWIMGKTTMQCIGLSGDFEQAMKGYFSMIRFAFERFMANAWEIVTAFVNHAGLN